MKLRNKRKQLREQLARNQGLDTSYLNTSYFGLNDPSSSVPSSFIPQSLCRELVDFESRENERVGSKHPGIITEPAIQGESLVEGKGDFLDLGFIFIGIYLYWDFNICIGILIFVLGF